MINSISSSIKGHTNALMKSRYPPVYFVAFVGWLVVLFAYNMHMMHRMEYQQRQHHLEKQQWLSHYELRTRLGATGDSSPSSSSGSRMSGWNQVVSTAFQRTIQFRDDNAAKFDLKSWSEKSDGGLADEDRNLLGRYYSKADSVFEFGLGESTYMASTLKVPRFAGIDSDPQWIKDVRAKTLPHFRYYFADIGETGEWGIPKFPDLAKNVYNYQVMPLQAEPNPFDVYLIDGRYRVACAMAAFLHAGTSAAESISGNGPVVIIHDCFHQDHVGTDDKDIEQMQLRARYHVADHLLDLVDHSGHKVCVYRRKPTTTDEDLYKIWQEHQFDMN
jgi:hypothetical protein